MLTKTESEQVGTLYIIGRTGKVEASQPKPAPTGTTVTATNLFKNLPVRKQFSSNSKKCKEELKKVEDLVMAYGLMHPSLRISLRHNKSVVWQKNKVSNHRTALLSVFGTALLAQLGAIESCGGEMNVIGYLPRPGSDIEITGRTVNDRCFVFLNGRPVNAKFIHQVMLLMIIMSLLFCDKFKYNNFHFQKKIKIKTICLQGLHEKNLYNGYSMLIMYQRPTFLHPKWEELVDTTILIIVTTR